MLATDFLFENIFMMLKKKFTLIPAAICIIMLACTSSKKMAGTAPQPPANITINGKLFTSLYQQYAAEYRALCYQAYNAGRMQIDRYAAPDNKPLALVTDIDETIFDNSKYAVYRGLQGKDYESISWYEWTDKSAADTMPGAGSFLEYAAAKGIEIFYITNRENRERSSTLKNLQRFALPNADEKHLLSRINVSSKEERRQALKTTHNIVLLMGDNLADFSNLFDKKNQEERKLNTDRAAAEFGKTFIVFPNPVYGDWEAAINKYKYNFTAAQKDSIIKSTLNGY